MFTVINFSVFCTIVFSENRQYPCLKCGRLFKSKVALRRHETYVCNNKMAIFSQLNTGIISKEGGQEGVKEMEKYQNAG